MLQMSLREANKTCLTSRRYSKHSSLQEKLRHSRWTMVRVEFMMFLFFSKLYVENQEGLVDVHNVMDVVYKITHIGMNHCTVVLLS